MIPRQYFLSLAVLALTVMPVYAGTWQEITEAAQADVPGNAPTAPPAVPPLPDLPRVRLAALPGFEDDAEYLRSISGRVTELEVQARQAGDPMRQAEPLLAAANLILAQQLEPTCTRRLLHVDGNMDEPGEADLRSALDRADALIERAGAALKEPQVREDRPADRLQQITHRLQTLGAFAAALRAFLSPDKGPQAARDARRAASGLAPLREDRNQPVAAAASLWQACLRSLESDQGPALSVLDLALSDPVPESMPYAFFARLLRCRLLADRGHPATALALLMQVEERCSEWLATDKEREDAVRAAQLAEIQITADWYRRLNGSEASSERKWCAERIQTLIGDSFGEDGNTVLRLTPAIPIVASPPGEDSAAPDPTPDED
ncbi:MAG: hypothetical protein JSU86_10590 [Phycisphaerales bacterium]|nr:MAG: hypothetical protein JSU86_10590 [Phycisphaerales bacterium]